MFILEILLIVVIGTFVVMICASTGKKPLVMLTKLMCGLLIVEVLVRTITPAITEVQTKNSDVVDKVYQAKQSMDRLSDNLERINSVGDRIENVGKGSMFGKIINAGRPRRD